jgi:hypothetical protein
LRDGGADAEANAPRPPTVAAVTALSLATTLVAATFVATTVVTVVEDQTLRALIAHAQYLLSVRRLFLS